MYLAFALLAPIVMFGLLPGLAWFEDRMLGPSAVRSEQDPAPLADPVPATDPDTAQDIAPAAAEDAAPLPAPIPLQPVAVLLPMAAPQPEDASARQHLRHTFKRRRGLHAA